MAAFTVMGAMLVGSDTTFTMLLAVSSSDGITFALHTFHQKWQERSQRPVSIGV